MRGERLLNNERRSEETNDRPDTEELTESRAEPEETPDTEVAQETSLVGPDEEIARLTGELEEVRELVRRKQAEFENYRKRVERERSEFIDYAASELVKEILPVLDNLERALGAPGGGGKRLREGVDIVYRQFRDILSRAGLREVEALGADFDPHVHEAVGRVETDEHREGEVVEVYQKGYFLKDRLLRPALVNVAQRPKETGTPQNTEEQKDRETENEHISSDATQS